MFEDRILDRNTGQMVNPNMEWYLLAGMSDMPQIDVRLKDQPERGVIGIGEPPTVPTAAAIALAVRNAIGVTMRSLPLTPAQDSATRCSSRPRRGRRNRGGFVKAFAYVNPTNEKDAVAALAPEFEKALPIGGGQDLLARMKDYITQPDRIVNVKNALDVDGDAANGGLRIGAAMKMVDLAEHAEVARLYPAIAEAAIEVGTPQIRNQGTVGGNLNQRPRCWYFRNEEFVCFKKGGNTVLLDRGREPVPRHLRRRAELHRAPVEPRGADGRLRRDVPPASGRRASGWCRRRTTSRCRPRTCGPRTCSRRTSC